jgi:DNA-directed RNA polymerase specialized sigma24 family protein
MAEAGEILGLSAAATRTRLWRALARLRKVLVR